MTLNYQRDRYARASNRATNNEPDSQTKEREYKQKTTSTVNGNMIIGKWHLGTDECQYIPLNPSARTHFRFNYKVHWLIIGFTIFDNNLHIL